jgi:pSer/pThr/pTyr-binding forkhead associated (FHA) protein
MISMPTDTDESGLLPNDLYISLEVIEGPDTGTTFTLSKTRTLIGRAAPDIRLNDPTVSGTHAAVEYVAGELVIADQNSSNGTFINGNKVDRSPLQNGDELKFANTKCMLHMVRDQYGIMSGPEAAVAEPEPEVPPVDTNATTDPRREIPNPELPTNIRILLHVVKGPMSGKKYLITKQSTLIGRGGDCDFQIYDETASRHHCQVQITAKGVAGIKDLASTNGTFLNNKFVSSVKLNNNDVITVGATYIRFIVLE